MTKTTAIFVAAAAALAMHHAEAASFDCQAATRAIDKAICASPRVSAMDSKMVDLYREAMKYVTDKSGLREAQRLWIRDVRDKCTSEQCLIEAYDDRIGKLLPGGGGYAMMVVAPDPTINFYRNPVWGIGPGLKTCELFEQGPPAALWGNRAPVNVDDSISANGRVLTRTGTRQDRTKDVYRFFLRKDECVATGNTGTSQQASTPTPATNNAAYVQRLRDKYMSRITFQTPYAQQVIEGYVIDCKAPDGRGLPLLNVMLAKLRSADSKDIWTAARVDSRGTMVRVYDQVVQHDRITNEELAFEVNEWGELRVVNARAEAVLNSCFGSYGPIWITR